MADTTTLLQNILFATASLVALTNPMAELPVFLRIVKGRSAGEVRSAAIRVALGVWIILALTAVTGMRFLPLFGISLPAFRSAGGLLLIVMGMEMLQGRESVTRDEASHSDGDEALWVPLVMPMLAGPGSIVATVSLTIRETPYLGWIHVATLTAISFSALLLGVILTLSHDIAQAIGQRGQRILIRFSGLILVAIGFQMGLTGVAAFFEAF